MYVHIYIFMYIRTIINEYMFVHTEPMIDSFEMRVPKTRHDTGRTTTRLIVFTTEKVIGVT